MEPDVEKILPIELRFYLVNFDILIHSQFGFHEKRNSSSAISRLMYVGNGTPQGTLLGPMLWVLGLTIDYNLTFKVNTSIWLEKKSDRYPMCAPISSAQGYQEIY